MDVDASRIALRRLSARTYLFRRLDPYTIGLALFILLPALLAIAQQTWTTDRGAHGPIVLATGAWLLMHNGIGSGTDCAARSNWRSLFALAAVLPIYVVGRAYDFLFLEAVGAYGAFVTWAYQRFGFAEVRRQLFPLFYLAFLIPLPGALLAVITGPLQMLVSSAAASVMEIAGYPVARHGVSIIVGPYQLLVEDACAGLNSLIGIIAIMLFYIYLVNRDSWRYAMILVSIIVPIAILVNIARVLTLILLTYYRGDAVAQGFMHDTTGLVLFGSGLVLILAIDTFVRRFRRTAA